MELGAILQYAGTHGPFLVIIALLLRSGAKKDDIIESMAGKATQGMQESVEMARLVKEVLMRPDG